ncbi:hypothetical protein [Haloferula sargassicola]|uniref:Uncharacterized protein n=1 Tax=Haloferula sargassicola TaxID=490096 RepID=A0ABP9USA8_9BACT
MITRSAIVTAALALTGAGLWTYAGARLAHEGKFEFQPNPLGIKRSPYGQVIAMAFQAPVDKDWHGGIEVHGLGGHDDHDHDHAHAADHPGEDDHGHHDHPADDDHLCEDESCDHDHELAEDGTCSCGHDHGSETEHGSPFIERLEHAVTERTNPFAPTEAHRFYLRRQIEDKLKFAYELDPSHYGNYAAYHFFLKEETLNTYEQTKEKKRQLLVALAEKTIRYCMKETTDPRPALTASAAAYNLLEMMIAAPPGTYSWDDFDRRLSDYDHCLKRHADLLEASVESGQWNLLSPARQDEVLQRTQLALKLRDAFAATLQHRYPGHAIPSPGL